MKWMVPLAALILLVGCGADGKPERPGDSEPGIETEETGTTFLG